MPYIGRSTEAFGVRTRYTYTPSAGDTSVSGADVNGLSLSFTDGAYVDVFLNGVRLKHNTDYVTTTANTIGSLAALAASDEIEVVVFDVFSLADMVSSANGGNFFNQVNFKTDSAVVAFGADNDVTLTHVADTGLNIKNTATGDDKPVVLTLQTGETDIAANDVLGTINFQAPDEGTGTDAILVAAGIEAVSEGDFSSSSNATKLSFKTGASEAASEKMSLSSAGLLTVSGAGTFGGILKTDDTTEATSTTDGSLQTDGGLSVAKDIVAGDDVKLLSDSAVLSFGADSEIQLIHVADDGLILKHIGTGDGKEPSFSFQAGDNDIAQDDILGQINFQAPDEGAGTDAILVAASIKAFSEGDFSASNNATTLEFATGRSAAAGSDGGRLQLASTGNLTLKNQNTADDSFPTFTLQTGDTDIAQDDVLGRVSFIAPDEGTGTDAITLAAAIDAVSEGNFAADNNATSLVFSTGSSGAASEKMRLSSVGVLSIPADGSDLTGVTNAIHLGASADMKIFHNSGNNYILTDQASQSFTVLSDVVRFNTRDNGESLFGATLDAAFFAKHDNVTTFQTITNGFKSDLTSIGGGIFNCDTGAGIYTFNTSSTSATIRDSSSIQAVGIDGNNGVVSTVSGGDSGSFGRQSNDGEVITIRQAGTQEGSISVSGSTVSYNAFTGSHWSRLTDNSKPTILRGTVMETIDEMCDWYHLEFTIPEVLWKKEEEDDIPINPKTGEPYFKVGDVKIPKNDMKCPYEKPSNVNEGDTVKYTHEGVEYDAKVVKDGDVKHVKAKISDTADCTNVYGVFFDWDNDDDTVNDMYVNALGTSLVRIHKDQTVTKGNLLVSNGDGTAKKQSDGIIRSKTIGKVLTNIKQETYSDGSYTVPCALYCG